MWEREGGTRGGISQGLSVVSLCSEDSLQKGKIRENQNTHFWPKTGNKRPKKALFGRFWVFRGGGFGVMEGDLRFRRERAFKQFFIRAWIWSGFPFLLLKSAC